MKTKDFFFDLPPELIAQKPSPERGQSRLLVYERKTDSIHHAMVADLPQFLKPETLMVFNNTRVRKARVFGKSPTGGEYEALLLECDTKDPAVWLCVARKAARLKLGSRLLFPENVYAEVIGCEENYRRIRFSPAVDDAWMERVGHIPLPPYIKREDEVADADRYQTVYAGPQGSVAAPTAGLHFTSDLLKTLELNRLVQKTVTLHVGLGTFLPVRTENIADHHMHREHYVVPTDTAEAISVAQSHNNPILAVGTTSLRTLESCSSVDGIVRAGAGSTDIFITPGYSFKVVDQLFTNFHTPESTLLMLVSAFAGIEEIRRVYAEAIRERYRFFSYGDAMLIL